MVFTMARTTQILLVDDLDGSEATITLTFGLEGSQYEIDLSDANAADFRRALAPYIAKSRRLNGTGRARSANRPTADKEQLAAMRDWARRNGYKVSDRGRVSSQIQMAYHTAARS